MNLQELIANHKGNRTYADLAEASGGLLNALTFRNIAIKETAVRFPNVDALQGIATALNFHINDVVLAAARSMGLDTQPMPDVSHIHERVFYHQHHAATYKAQLTALRARIIPVKP